MQGIQVKAVESIEAQSIQEQEAKLLEAHEAKFSEPEVVEESNIQRIDLRNVPQVAQEEVQATTEIGEEQLLSEINSRLGIKINSLEDLKEARESNGDMDEEMSAFLNIRKRRAVVLMTS